MENRRAALENAKTIGLAVFGAFYVWMAVQTVAPLPLWSPLLSSGFRCYLIIGPLSILPTCLLSKRFPSAAGVWLCGSWIASSVLILRYDQTFVEPRFFILNNSPVFLVGSALLFGERARRLKSAAK